MLDKIGKAKQFQHMKQLPSSDPLINYFPPAKGPFRCDNCKYFLGDGRPCQKVSDPVESAGCCNVFDN